MVRPSLRYDNLSFLPGPCNFYTSLFAHFASINHLRLPHISPARPVRHPNHLPSGLSGYASKIGVSNFMPLYTGTVGIAGRPIIILHSLSSLLGFCIFNASLFQFASSISLIKSPSHELFALVRLPERPERRDAKIKSLAARILQPVVSSYCTEKRFHVAGINTALPSY